ncbi:hypothetical protein BDB01DRAFT_58726 [Pilobolus umbonatus]|nr:hypothetical protein BDB01DRAFT_58726 [Pilobolus umbonatus]
MASAVTVASAVTMAFLVSMISKITMVSAMSMALERGSFHVHPPLLGGHDSKDKNRSRTKSGEHSDYCFNLVFIWPITLSATILLSSLLNNPFHFMLLQPQRSSLFLGVQPLNGKNTTIRSTLQKIVQENHFLYKMENRDRPNNIARLLVGLHELGATPDQLSIAYNNVLVDTESIHNLDHCTRINKINWDQFLGQSSYYEDYLVFFDQQLAALGLTETLNTYFYSIPNSIGSQLQPLVHLSFGIEQDLPEIITQALAYHAITYIDASAILDYEDNRRVISESKRDLNLMNSILFDLIGADPRFEGKVEGYITFQFAVKLLIESKSDLIKTYLMLWNQSSLTLNQRLDALILTAVQLMKSSSRRNRSNDSLELDWFLGGSQLVDSALAMKKMIPHKHMEHWVNLQFISTVCTYIVQGRPKQSSPIQPSFSWKQCISEVVQSGDTKAILSLISLLKLNASDPALLEVGNMLAQFTMNGTWVKTGLGWI